MPNSNGKIYVDNTTNPPKGVSIADVQTVLGETSGDLGTLCQSNNINKYSKFKPVRWNTIGQVSLNDLRHPLCYGIYVDASMDFQAEEQYPYWQYRQPRGWDGYHEPYRLHDFNGYNHNAQNPMKETDLTYDQSSHLLKVTLEDVRNPNADIDLNDFTWYPSGSYIGVVIWDRTNRQGYYCTSSMRFGDITSSWELSFYTDLTNFSFAKNDTIDVFLCLYHESTSDQDDQLNWEEITGGVANSMVLMATDETHGHTSFTLTNWLDVENELKFTNTNTAISGTGSTDYTLTAFVTTMECTYSWRADGTEVYYMDWKLVADGENTGHTGIFDTNSNVMLTKGNSENGYVLRFENSMTWSSSTLRDNENIIAMAIYGRAHGADTWKTYASINYNIVTREITWTAY